MLIELIYDRDCPNIGAARAQLLRAFAKLKIMPKWQEWEQHDEAAPAYVQQYGSPTILVNQKDICEQNSNQAKASCRIYQDEKGGLTKTPSLQSIISALSTAKGDNKATLSNFFAVLPSVGIALLPRVFCPSCWPAYTGLLSALGLSFVNYTPYLLPLMILFLSISLFMLAYKAPKRRGYRPFVIGTMAAGMMLLSQSLIASQWLLYGGIVLLIAASIWNSWPKNIGQCAACVD